VFSINKTLVIEKKKDYLLLKLQKAMGFRDHDRMVLQLGPKSGLE
jgi:hypothetical protein